MKTLFLKKYGIDLATRDTARLIFKDVLCKNYKCISFKDTDFASRSFLDEIFLLSWKYKVEIINIPRDLQPLYEIVQKSRIENKVYAPILKIGKIQTLQI